MKVLLLFGIIILLSGCTLQPQQATGNVVMEIEEPFCAASYFEYQTGKCCLDANSNNVCDEDDLIAKELEKIEEGPVIEEQKPFIEAPKEEVCPFTCAEGLVCEPIYANKKITRWACVQVKE